MAIPHNPDPGPAPVVVRVANCQSVSAGPRKAAGIYRTALTKVGRFGVPHVVLACECSDFDAELIRVDGWSSIQYVHNTAAAGSAIAWRNGEQVGDARLVVGSEAGEGIRTRYVAQATLRINGHKATFNAGHAPPDRAPNGQRQWLDNAGRLPGVVGADFNTWPKTLDRRFNRKVRGVEVLSLLIPNDIPCSRAKPVDIGGDHPAVDVVLWPTVKRRK